MEKVEEERGKGEMATDKRVQTLVWELPFGYSTLPYFLWINRGPSGAPQPNEVQDVGC
jgi:hypothetical protein